MTYFFGILGFLYVRNTFPSSKFNIEGNISDFVVLGLFGPFGPFGKVKVKINVAHISAVSGFLYVPNTFASSESNIEGKILILGLLGLFGPFRRS